MDFLYTFLANLLGLSSAAVWLCVLFWLIDRYKERGNKIYGIGVISWFLFTLALIITEVSVK